MYGSAQPEKSVLYALALLLLSIFCYERNI